MAWISAATIGVLSVGTGAFVYLLVANLEPQPEYPNLMTALLRLIGIGIAVCGVGIGVAFLVAAGLAYTG
ncbi:hypothetical protein [Natrinema halophilum]|uniref:Uncharacterized protein n=1 Tax=Natrinema halophilum TaxID=1699371 RepID=A0A7D5KYB0_9EURY|nr:hypothetical protein [Natrinema halophilum]QLG50382.1 hypothetical protein HYG82_16780 [Natrinema halophilum]